MKSCGQTNQFKLVSERLETRLALSASPDGLDVSSTDAVYERPELKPATSLSLTPSSWGPSPVTIGIDSLKGAVETGDEDMSFVITNVANGYVEKFDGQSWVNISQTPKSSNPRELLNLLQLRQIKQTDQLRWVPGVIKETSVRSFSFVGWDGKQASKTLSSVEASVPTLAHDIVVEQEVYSGEYSIASDGTVNLKTGLAPFAHWFDETGELGYNNYKFLLDTYDQLSDENGYIRMGVAIGNDAATETDDQFFVVNLTEPPTYTGRDTLEFVGVLAANIGAASPVAGIVGQQMWAGHNSFRTQREAELIEINDARTPFLPGGHLYHVFSSSFTGESHILIDTYTEAEYLGSTNSYEFGANYEIMDVDGVPTLVDAGSGSINSDDFNGFLPSDLTKQWTDTFEIFNKSLSDNKKIKPLLPNGFDINLLFEITPTLDVNIQSPGAWYEKLCFGKWDISLGVALNWQASATLTTGFENGRMTIAEDNGDPFRVVDFPFPAIPGPAGTVIGISATLDISAMLEIPGVQDEYVWSISQDLGMQISTDGANSSWCGNNKQFNKQPENFSSYFHDPVIVNPAISWPNALGSRLDITPGLEVDFGYKFAKVPIAQLTGSIRAPFHLFAFANWGRNENDAMRANHVTSIYDDARAINPNIVDLGSRFFGIGGNNAQTGIFLSGEIVVDIGWRLFKAPWNDPAALGDIIMHAASSVFLVSNPFGWGLLANNGFPERPSSEPDWHQRFEPWEGTFAKATLLNWDTVNLLT